MNKYRQILIPFLLLFGILVLCVGCGSETVDHTGEAQIPEKASELTGLNYEEVQQKFIDAGFTNIQLERLDDLITGWLKDDGEVKEVLVDGDDEFLKSSWIAADTPVVIRYHSFKEKDDPKKEQPTDVLEQEQVTSEEPVETDVIGEAPPTPVQETPVQEEQAVEEVAEPPAEVEPEEVASVEEQPVTEQQTEVYTEAPVEETNERAVEETPLVPATDNTGSTAQDYVLNTNTMRFHYPGCRSVSDIYDEHREDVTATRDEVISWGYVSCGNCHP